MTRKVTIATPSYDGTVVGQTAQSVAHAAAELADEFAVKWDIEYGCAFLDLARSLMARRFLDTDADELVFIDGDVGFEPDVLRRLLRLELADGEVAGCGYPYKTDFGGFPVHAVLDAQKRPLRPVKNASGDYTVECHIVPTGFLRLPRAALIRAFDAATELGRGCRHIMYPRLPLIFHMGPLEPWGDYLGEDVTFAQMWRSLPGCRMLVMPDAVLTHTGRRTWGGNLHEYWRALPGGDLSANPQPPEAA